MDKREAMRRARGIAGTALGLEVAEARYMGGILARSLDRYTSEDQERILDAIDDLAAQMHSRVRGSHTIIVNGTQRPTDFPLSDVRGTSQSQELPDQDSNLD
jgi:hypothetical protein